MRQSLSIDGIKFLFNDCNSYHVMRYQLCSSVSYFLLKNIQDELNRKLREGKLWIRFCRIVLFYFQIIIKNNLYVESSDKKYNSKLNRKLLEI